MEGKITYDIVTKAQFKNRFEEEFDEPQRTIFDKFLKERLLEDYRKRETKLFAIVYAKNMPKKEKVLPVFFEQNPVLSRKKIVVEFIIIKENGAAISLNSSIAWKDRHGVIMMYNNTMTKEPKQLRCQSLRLKDFDFVGICDVQIDLLDTNYLS